MGDVTRYTRDTWLPNGGFASLAASSQLCILTISAMINRLDV